MRRLLPPNPTSAADADAGDCFVVQQKKLACLPTVINIGVQKAGTGELQTWLAAHPHAIAHGGEVHYFDTFKKEPACDTVHARGTLRLRYAKFLWGKRLLDLKELRNGKKKLLFEKTPAYFDRASPFVVRCAVPSVKLLVMLRMPVARAISAFRMCKDELAASWCAVSDVRAVAS